MAGEPSYKPTPRYIVHTDIEDVQPPEPEGEVIELPPQYSERQPMSAGLSPIEPPGLDHATLPSGAAPPNPLDTEHGQWSARLQQPIAPDPPTPTTPHWSPTSS